MHFRRAHQLIRPSLALFGILACARTEKAPAADSAPAASAMPTAEPTVITIVASDFKYDAPDTIAAGMVSLKLVNKGPELHHISIARLTGGKTFADFGRAMKTMKPTDQPPAWMETVAGPNAPVPGGEQVLTEELTPGNYVLICFIPSADNVPHFAKGMVKSLTVVPSTGAVAAAPVADVTVMMTDYAWQISPVITAGKHIIRLENSATQPHEMFIVRLEKGKTPMDAAVWAETRKGPQPGMPMGGVSGMAKGAVAYLPVDLTPGEYALICFLPDMKDGKLHFLHGMMKSITVN